MMNEYNLAVLTGNGMTTAFNENLSLKNLTEAAFQQMPNIESEDILRTILEDTRPGANGDDFEELLGVLESMGRSMRLIESLADKEDAEDSNLRNALEVTKKHIAKFHRYGKGHVLERIFYLTSKEFEQRGALNAVIDQITKSTAGNIVFGNLNYDTTLLSALLNCDEEVWDMGHGAKSTTINLDGERFTVQRLRNSQDQPGARIGLVHLHGSVTYWRRRGGYAGGVKFKTSQIDTSRMFAKYRDGETRWTPSVVLANQERKTENIGRQPFKLSYEMFEDALVNSPKWLIIGYSFKDAAINEMLSRCIEEAERQPDILVVGWDGDPSLRRVIKSLEWDVRAAYRGDGVLNVIHVGAQQFTDHGAWDRFIGRAN